MTYTMLSELSESRLIPSRTSLAQWKLDDLRPLAYLYFIALRILLSSDSTAAWARKYVERTITENNFDQWRSDGNDLYVLLHAIQADSGLSVSPIRDWMHHVHNDLDAHTHKLFQRLDAMFHVHSSDLKSLRRDVTHWEDKSSRTRDDLVAKAIQQIEKHTSHSELVAKLKSLSKRYRGDVSESASAGATGAASVATAVGSVGGLGAGFSPNEMWRSVYGDTKPVVIQRKSTKKK